MTVSSVEKDKEAICGDTDQEANAEKKEREKNFRQTQASSIGLRLLTEGLPPATVAKSLCEKQLSECSED